MTWYVDSQGNATDRPRWATGLPLRRVPAEPGRKPNETAPGWSAGETRALILICIFVAAVLLFGVIGSRTGPPCHGTLKRRGVIPSVEVELREPKFDPSRLPEDDLRRQPPLELAGDAYRSAQ